CTLMADCSGCSRVRSRPTSRNRGWMLKPHTAAALIQLVTVTKGMTSSGVGSRATGGGSVGTVELLQPLEHLLRRFDRAFEGIEVAALDPRQTRADEVSGTRQSYPAQLARAPAGDEGQRAGGR